MNEVPTVFEQVQAQRQPVVCETVKSAAVASTRTAPLGSTKSTSTQQSSKSRGKYATSDEDNAKTEFEIIQVEYLAFSAIYLTVTGHRSTGRVAQVEEPATCGQVL